MGIRSFKSIRSQVLWALIITLFVTALYTISSERRNLDHDSVYNQYLKEIEQLTDESGDHVGGNYNTDNLNHVTGENIQHVASSLEQIEESGPYDDLNDPMFANKLGSDNEIDEGELQDILEMPDDVVSEFSPVETQNSAHDSALNKYHEDILKLTQMQNGINQDAVKDASSLDVQNVSPGMNKPPAPGLLQSLPFGGPHPLSLDQVEPIHLAAKQPLFVNNEEKSANDIGEDELQNMLDLQPEQSTSHNKEDALEQYHEEIMKLTNAAQNADLPSLQPNDGKSEQITNFDDNIDFDQFHTILDSENDDIDDYERDGIEEPEDKLQPVLTNDDVNLNPSFENNDDANQYHTVLDSVNDEDEIMDTEDLGDIFEAPSLPTNVDTITVSRLDNTANQYDLGENMENLNEYGDLEKIVEEEKPPSLLDNNGPILNPSFDNGGFNLMPNNDNNANANQYNTLLELVNSGAMKESQAEEEFVEQQQPLFSTDNKPNVYPSLDKNVAADQYHSVLYDVNQMENAKDLVGMKDTYEVQPPSPVLSGEDSKLIPSFSKNLYGDSTDNIYNREETGEIETRVNPTINIPTQNQYDGSFAEPEDERLEKEAQMWQQNNVGMQRPSSPLGDSTHKSGPIYEHTKELDQYHDTIMQLSNDLNENNPANINPPPASDLLQVDTPTNDLLKDKEQHVVDMLLYGKEDLATPTFETQLQTPSPTSSNTSTESKSMNSIYSELEEQYHLHEKMHHQGLRVLVLGRMSGGATSMTSFINTQLQDYFYVYEPGHFLLRYNTRDSLLLQRDDSEYLDSIQDGIMSILHGVFRCNFERQPDIIKAFNESGSIYRGKSRLGRQMPHPITEATLTQTCKSKRHVISKVIRINNISTFIPLIRADDVKVVFVARDPRGMACSRHRRYIRTPSTYNEEDGMYHLHPRLEENIKEHCNWLETNYKAINSGPFSMKDHSILVRFEDMARFPYVVIPAVTKFLLLPKTGLEPEMGYAPHADAITTWKKYFSFQEVLRIQRLCPTRVFEMFGWKLVRNENEMKDIGQTFVTEMPKNGIQLKYSIPRCVTTLYGETCY
ncbi:uncharacterized protein LOC144354073 [Saccoglossus kowalevskii]